jgi:hypothetical protein
LKSFARTPRTNSIAVYWETFGGLRSFQLWNEHTSRKILEYGLSQDPAAATYALAAMNIAMHDACIACWDAKFTYWQIRRSQLDSELKTLFPPPNHPSYPAVYARVFPDYPATSGAPSRWRTRVDDHALGDAAAAAEIRRPARHQHPQHAPPHWRGMVDRCIVAANRRCLFVRK